MTSDGRYLHRVVVAVLLLAVAGGCGKKGRKVLAFVGGEPKPTTSTPSYPTMADPDYQPVHFSSCGEDISCRLEGRCSEVTGRCLAATNVDCLNSQGCEESGRCTASEGRCVVANDADCRRAKACDERGMCMALSGVCAATPESCRKIYACREAGLCTEKSGRCVAGSDADCKQSRACKTDHWCVNRSGACAGQ